MPVATISTVSDFVLKSIPCCVMNNSDHIAFMASAHPDVALQVVNSTYASDLLRAVADPAAACSGAVMPDVVAAFLLGPAGDPDGVFCSLAITGESLSNGFYAIAFHSLFPLNQVLASPGRSAGARAAAPPPLLACSPREHPPLLRTVRHATLRTVRPPRS